jgi:hypothetical protein
METPTETTLPVGTPLPDIIGIAAIGIGVLLLGRERE